MITETDILEPTVSLTTATVDQIKSMHASKPEDVGKPLRVYVEKGGCSGMQYSMTFDEERDGDLIVEQDGVRVVVDSFSIDFLKGAIVDYSDDLTGGGFKIHNPSAAHTCGCGRSFE
tara:strand:+ start:67 stop:417 length:351 start_codon:yes stop_codon:yes gene_type:complete